MSFKNIEILTLVSIRPANLSLSDTILLLINICLVKFAISDNIIKLPPTGSTTGPATAAAASAAAASATGGETTGGVTTGIANLSVSVGNGISKTNNAVTLNTGSFHFTDGVEKVVVVTTIDGGNI